MTQAGKVTMRVSDRPLVRVWIASALNKEKRHQIMMAVVTKLDVRPVEFDIVTDLPEGYDPERTAVLFEYAGDWDRDEIRQLAADIRTLVQ